MASSLLNVRIVTPKGIIFSGQAESVSSTNSMGPFDILAEHATFITMISGKPLVIRIPGKEPVTYTFPLSIVFAAKDKINIYTDIKLSTTKD